MKRNSIKNETEKVARPDGVQAVRLRKQAPGKDGASGEISKNGKDGSDGKNEARYFLGYQAAWIRDESKLKICQKGRQIGLSYADSYDSVRKAAQQNGRDVWVMSRDEVQAKQYILYCKRWANVLRYAAEDLGEQVINVDGGKTACVQVLRFASGASIYALSSNPDAIVGKTGHVKLDEFALHKDQRQLFAVAKPVIQWGGTLSIISTHRGVGTVFNQIITDIKERGNKMGWSLHTIAIQRAVEDGIVEKIDQATGGALTAEWRKSSVASNQLSVVSLREWWLAKQRAECIDEEQWLQEYCCRPADEATAFLSYDMITACEDATLRLHSSQEVKEMLGKLPSDTTLYMGLDVARKKDLCVFDLGRKLGDVMHDWLRLELQGKRFAEIREELYQLLRLPALKRTCIDATGMGMQLAEEAKEQFGYRVEPVTFTGAMKEEMAFGLRQDFEDRKLRIVRDDKLRADFRGIKKEVTGSGNIRFAGESEDSHCDRFWAKALRQSAARTKVQFSSITI